MYRRNALTAAMVLAGGLWVSAAMAGTGALAQFESAADIDKASEWIGMPVRDKEGNEVGKLSDFAIHAGDGSIVYAVVATGGWFTTKSIAVPLSALVKSTTATEGLILQASKTEWQAAETFGAEDWPVQALVLGGRTEAPVSTETVSARDTLFDRLDTDGDGYLSREEIEAAEGLTVVDRADLGEDGRISRSEFAAFEARERERSMHKDSSKKEYDESKRKDAPKHDQRDY
jgi:sporulation protein YlmC with PRC-barrel domain